MNTNIIVKLGELLENAEKWVIVDAEGKQHELSEGITGTPKKIEPKQEIYELLGINPKYITFENLRTLDDVFKSIIELVYFDASYSVQKKYKDYLNTGEVVKKERKKKEPKAE